MRHKILVVDDDAQVIELLSYNLRAAGFQVVVANNGPTALLRVDEHRPALILLGLAFPQIQAFDACRRLKGHVATKHVPLIIFSAQAAEQDRILGFELGADDYVVMPFSVIELVLRIGKSLQRMADREIELPTKQKIAIGDLILDPNRHEVTIRGAIVPLTPIEFKLLTMLMERSDGALDRETLITGIWGRMNNSDSRTIDAHVKRLRGKLGPIGSALETITGFGYRLNEAPMFASADSPYRNSKGSHAKHGWVPREKSKSRPRLKKQNRSPALDPEFFLSVKAA